MTIIIVTLFANKTVFEVKFLCVCMLIALIIN